LILVLILVLVAVVFAPVKHAHVRSVVVFILVVFIVCAVFLVVSQKVSTFRFVILLNDYKRCDFKELSSISAGKDLISGLLYYPQAWLKLCRLFYFCIDFNFNSFYNEKKNY